nr:uncharacterized protein LOC109158503 [Ipomoea batatas]
MESNVNANALESQRSSEDSDLLERSTRKRKVAGGATGSESPMPMESPDDGSTNPGEVEVVAETPLGDVLVSGMQVEENTETQPMAEAETGSRSMQVPPIVEAPPRSYRDSVVGSGTGAAPFMMPSPSEDEEADPTGDDELDDETCANARMEEAVADTTVGSDVNGQEAALPRHANQFGGIDKTNPAARRSAPYGSWMLVTRNDRRNSRRPSGAGNQNETGGRTTTPGGASRASGSRYAPLEQEAVTEDTPAPEQPGRRADKQPAVGGSDAVRNRNRSRRPNVVVNEQQIENDRPIPSANIATEQAPPRRTAGSGLRRAAEEDEHVVSRGEQGGQVIHSTRVVTGESSGMNAAVPENIPPEHHSDPPDDFDLEGDVDYLVFGFTSAQSDSGRKNIHQVFCVGDLNARLQEGGDQGSNGERFHGRVG